MKPHITFLYLGMVLIFIGIVAIGFAEPIEWRFGHYNLWTIWFLLAGCFSIAVYYSIDFFIFSKEKENKQEVKK